MTRVSDITTEIKRYRNEPTTDPFTTNADCLAWINQAQNLIAADGYWKYEALADITGETGSLAFGDVATDELEDGVLLSVESIRWVYDGANYVLTPLMTEARYQGLLQNTPTGGTLGAYFIKRSTIYWFPVPEDDCNEGVKIYGTWAPPALTGLPGGDAPYTPAKHDVAYIYYGIAQAWLKDHTSDNYLQNYQVFMGLWQQEKDKLLNKAQSPAPRVKPYRR